MGGRPNITFVRHYEVLGVDPTASMAEIRSCYLRLARASHPDFHNDSDDDRLLAETRMRAINAAWAVLGDVDERAAYDRRRIEADPPTRSRPFHAETAAHEDWKPFDDSAVEQFDEREDQPITSSSLPRWLAIAPPTLLAAGLIGLVLGGLVDVIVLVEGGLAAVVLSGVLFLAAPMFALSSSRRQDDRP